MDQWEKKEWQIESSASCAKSSADCLISKLPCCQSRWMQPQGWGVQTIMRFHPDPMLVEEVHSSVFQCCCQWSGKIRNTIRVKAMIFCSKQVSKFHSVFVLTWFWVVQIHHFIQPMVEKDRKTLLSKMENSQKIIATFPTHFFFKLKISRQISRSA